MPETEVSARSACSIHSMAALIFSALHLLTTIGRRTYSPISQTNKISPLSGVLAKPDFL
jgi:hypothetical protein